MPGRVLAAFGLAFLALLILGGIGYRFEKARLERRAEGELAYLATLHRDRLDRWLGTRMANAALAAEDPGLREWLLPQGARTDLRPWLQALARHDMFSALAILGRNGQVLASTGTLDFTDADRAAIQKAWSHPSLTLAWDLNNASVPPSPRIACLAPLPGGTLWARLDTSALMGEINRNPPNYLPSLETFVMCRQGATRAVLNPSRIHSRPLPDAGMDQKELVGVQALLGGEGVYSGVDYRSAPVIAYGCKLTHLPWTLLAKVDQGDVMAELARLAWFYGGLGTLLLGSILAVLAAWWRKDQAWQREVHAREKAERTLLEGRLESLSRHANDVVLLLDAQGRILDVNDRACETYGYTRQQLLQLAIRDLRPLDASGTFEDQYHQVVEHYSVRFETTHVRKNGSFFPVEVSSRAFLYQGAIYVQSILRDITERKAAQQALAESEARFRQLLEEIPQVAVMLDPEGCITFCNAFFCHLTGWTEAYLLGQNWFRTCIPEPLRPSMEAMFRETLRTGQVPSGLENTVMTRDGREVEVAWSNTALRGTDGRILGTASLGLDITARKAAERTLRESEARLRLATEGAAIAVWEYDFRTDTMTRSANHNALYGLEPQPEWNIRAFLQAALPEDRAASDAHIRSAVAPGGPDRYGFDFRVVHPDGSLHWLRVMGRVVTRDEEGRGLTARGTLQDVTERKVAEQALRASETRLRLALEGAAIAVWEYDFRTNTMSRSENHDALYGLEPQPVWDIGTFLGATHPEDRELSSAQIQAAVAPGGPETYAFDFRVVHPDGSTHWLSVTGQVVERDAEGRGLLVRGTLQDITARKTTESSLRAVSLAMEQSPVSVVLTDPAGTILHVNPAFCRVTGFTREEALFQNPRILKSDRQDEAFYKALWDTLLAGQPWMGELVNRKKDGTLYIERAVISPVHDEDGNLVGYVAVKEDITERKQQERQLARMNRLYAAQSQLNQAVVRLADEQELLDRVCHLMVEVGGFALAWVGWDDPASHMVTVAARSEDPHGYLAGIRIRSDDTPEGRGPTGICIREGRPMLENDFQASAMTRPWRDRGAEAGFGSSASFPIHRGGRVAGAVTVYGGERDFFGPEETALLQGAAADLSFALEAMDSEGERARLMNMLDASQNEIYIVRGDTMEVAYANQGALRALDQTPQQLLGRKPWEINAELPEAAIRERLGQLLREGPGELVVETHHRRRDGSSYPVEVHIQAFPTRDRVDFLTVAMDISERRRMTQDLVESQSLLSALVESTPDLIWTVDPVDYGLVTFNTGLRDYFLKHRQINLAKGMRPEELFPPGAFVQRWKDYYLATLANGTFETEYTSFSNTHTLLLRFSLLRRGTEVFGISVFGRDITDRKQAELALQRNEAWLRAIFASMNEGFSVQDVLCDDQGHPRDLRFVAANPAFERQTGLSNEAALGHTLLELFPDAEPSWIERYGRVGLTGEATQFEAPFGPLDRYYTVSAFQITPGQLGVLFSDISERRQAEAQIQRMNEELEVRVRERTAQLEAANREMEAFSYSVSHDLRAPLRGMDGFARALEEDFASRLDDEGRRYLLRIRTAAQRMGQLIDDLLKLSRVSRGELERVPVELDALARGILDALAEGQPDRTVQVSVAPDLRVEGDPRLLAIVLENLLGNAWKYSRNRAEAHITLGALDQPGSRVFFVRDDGAGFDMAYADKLFQPFQRLHAAKEFEGSGIGLAIVQRIIHRHGGHIWAESAPGEGATIYFTLEGGAA